MQAVERAPAGKMVYIVDERKVNRRRARGKRG